MRFGSKFECFVPGDSSLAPDLDARLNGTLRACADAFLGMP